MATDRNYVNCLCPYATNWRDGTQEDKKKDNKQRIVVLTTWLITYFYVEYKLYALQLLINVMSLAGRYVYVHLNFPQKGIYYSRQIFH